MELTFNDLKKRDVINISDGRCLGRVTNLKLKFPQGVMVGIFVPGKKRGLFSCFDKTEIFIESNKILKIGGDVILVDLKSGASVSPKPQPPQLPPCPPPCNPYPPNCNPCAPVCPPQPPFPPKNEKHDGISANDFTNAFTNRFDEGDY